MSKCTECKYEHLSKSEHPCSVCRWKIKERGLAFFGKLSYFEPKEQPTTEYNVCNDCCYEWLDKLDAPCCDCKYRFDPETMARLKAKDCFKPKEKKHSSNCTISAKECNKSFKNEDYGYEEISNDEIDMVNHPLHYNRDGAMECIDEMITVFGKDIVACFCLCNVWKYRYRASDKGHEEDLSKSDYYMAKYKELITERSVLGFESVMECEELEDIVKEKLDKLYLEREIKKHDKHRND